MDIADELLAVTAGAEFRRADLHIHSFGSDGSYDVNDPAMTPEAIVETAVREGLQVVSVTDHNWIGNVPRALRQAEGKDILVLPGVELSTPQGHLLVYCPTYCDLSRFFGKLTISSDHKTCGQTFVQCLQLAAEHGGLGIAAHIELESGFELALPKYGAFKEELFCCPYLLALEITKPESERWFTERDDSPDRKRLARLRREKAGEEEEYELAKVMGSDAHKLSVLGKNASGAKKLTRLKMEALTFGAFRIALLDPSARTRIEDLIPSSVPHFVGMRLEGGFLRDQVVRFSKNLTCVIGGRGAGKSTLLEALRVGSGNNARPEVVDSEVWPDRIVLLYQDEAGRRHTLFRDKARAVYNPFDEFDGITHVPIESYGQGETAETIQHCGKDPGILLRFLDGFVDLSVLAARDQELRGQLLDNQEEVERLQLEVDSMPTIEKALRVAEGHLRVLKENDAGEVVGLEEKLGQERAFREDLKRRLGRLTSSINQSLSDTSGIDWVLTADGSSLVVGNEEFEQVRELIRGYSSQIKAARGTLQSESLKVTQSIQQRLRAWEQKEADTQGQIEALRKKLEGRGVRLDMGFIRKVTKDVPEYTRKLAELREKKGRLTAALKARNELLAERRRTKAKVFAERGRFATAMNANLKATITDYAVTLKFHEGCLSSEFEELLKAAMGWRTSQVPKARLIASQLRPLALAEAVKGSNKAPLRAVKGEDGQRLLAELDVDAIHEALIQPEHLFALQRCPFEDRPELKVTREVEVPGERPRHVAREFARLSLGQQQALLLSIMLFSRSKQPLVIDQPEDNLDSEFIYKTFVKTLRTVKERRQVIIVTHNANIAVLGDAELIVPLKSSSDWGTIRDRGSIDTPATKAMACAILEGSEQAFKKRQRIYGHGP